MLCTVFFCLLKDQLTEATVKELFGSQEAAIWFSRENFASCLDRFVRLFDCSVLKGELYFVFGSTCAIIELFRSQGRTVLRVWIDLCDYLTVPFSRENFTSCLDRLVRLLNCSVLKGEPCFVFGAICAII